MARCSLGFVLAALAPLLLFAPMLRADPFNTTFELIPAAPRYMEEVRLRVHRAITDCYLGADVAMSGNKITVAATRVVETCAGITDYDLGRFPAGEYSVEVVSASAQSIGPPLGTLSFIVPTRTVAGVENSGYGNVNFTDLWWDPQRSGWGVMITHRPDGKLFAAWFDYGQSGQPVWYTFLGSARAAYRFTGQVMISHGPNPASPPFVQSVGITVVGEGTFLFGADLSEVNGRYDKGRMSVEINGTVHESPIERFQFD